MENYKRIIELKNELEDLGFTPTKIKMKQAFLDKLIEENAYEKKFDKYYIFGLLIKVNETILDDFVIEYRV